MKDDDRALSRARRDPGGRPGSPTLAYAGVDLLLTGDRQWKVIEINDHPVALAQSRRLCSSDAALECFRQDPFQLLAEQLERHDGGGAVALLLPECFELARGHRSPSQIRLREALKFDDNRVDLTISDFNELSRAIIARGREARICDAAHLRIQHRELYLDGEIVRSLFRRHSGFPRQRVDCFCLNDLRQRALCGDKLATHREIVARLGDVASIPTFPFEPSERTLGFLDDCACRGILVIVKPKWGSASVGVTRMDAGLALQHLATHQHERKDLICQPWIAPAVARVHERNFHFDVRLYVVAGRVVSGFARRAAAPSTGAASESPLAWLTTTGPRMTLCSSVDALTDSSSSPHAILSTDEIAAMTHLAADATLALSDAGVEMNYESAVETIPAFHSLADMQPEYQMLQIVEA